MEEEEEVAPQVALERRKKKQALNYAKDLRAAFRRLRNFWGVGRLLPNAGRHCIQFLPGRGSGNSV